MKIFSSFLCFLFICCSSSTNEKDHEKKVEVSSAAIDTIFHHKAIPDSLTIYCLCAAYDDIEKRIISTCTFTGRLDPIDIIYPENIYYKSDDSLALRRFSKLYKSSYSSSFNHRINSTIVILTYYKNHVDTIDYIDNNTFAINNKYFLQYQYNLLDSVTSIFNLKYISCIKNGRY